MEAPTPPGGNRPPPPPPRSPQGGGAATPPVAPASLPQSPPPAPPAPPSPMQGGYPEQQSAYPQQPGQPPPPPPYGYPQQSQSASPYSPQGQYYPYAPARTGLPMWVWLGGGGALLVIIGVVVVVLVLTLGGRGGQGGQSGQSSPREAAQSFWTNMIQHNYEAARALLAPESALTSDQLRQSMEGYEAAAPGRFTSVTATNENLAGDTATIPLVIQTDNGRVGNLTAAARNVDNRWFITTPGIPNIPTLPE